VVHPFPLDVRQLCARNPEASGNVGTGSGNIQPTILGSHQGSENLFLAIFCHWFCLGHHWSLCEKEIGGNEVCRILGATLYVDRIKGSAGNSAHATK
jgi:hypothetical protein